MSIEIKGFVESKRELLRQAQDDLCEERIGLMEPKDGLGTFYAEFEGKIVGVMSLFNNSLHAHFYHLEIAIPADDKSTHIALMSHMLGVKRDYKPLQITLNQPELASYQWFIERYKFDLAISCECPWLDSFIAPDYAPVAGLEIMRASELTPEQASALRHHRIEGYIKTHYWSPALPAKHPNWSSTDLDVQSLQLSMVALLNGKVVANSDAHIYDSEIWLGWGWHAPVVEQQNVAIWAQMLAAQWPDLQQLNTKIRGEYDSSDWFAAIKRSFFVESKKDAYVILQQSQF